MADPSTRLTQGLSPRARLWLFPWQCKAAAKGGSVRVARGGRRRGAKATAGHAVSDVSSRHAGCGRIARSQPIRVALAGSTGTPARFRLGLLYQEVGKCKVGGVAIALCERGVPRARTRFWVVWGGRAKRPPLPDSAPLAPMTRGWFNTPKHSA